MPLDGPLEGLIAVAVEPDRALRLKETQECALDQLTLADLQAIDPRITAQVFSVLGVEESAASRTSFGGTAPANVSAAARMARQRFL